MFLRKNVITKIQMNYPIKQHLLSPQKKADCWDNPKLKKVSGVLLTSFAFVIPQRRCLSTYGYNNSEWPDLLTSFNGEEITYDASGNPLRYYENRSMIWNGRQLSDISFEYTMDSKISFVYDADGRRTEKIYRPASNAEFKTEYYYNGDTLIGESYQIRFNYETVKRAKSIFLYDASGTVYGIEYYLNDATTPTKIRYLVRNLQGDVIGEYDETGAITATYTYDDWGRTLSCTGDVDDAGVGGLVNPFRYRGYYYDSETGYYYLNSRYYDPETGRFLNADDIDFLGADGSSLSYNLFAYCMNNPVNLSDETGTWPSWATKLAIGIGAIVIGAAVVAATAATGGVAAAFVGAAVAGLKAAAVSGIIGAAVGAGTRAVSHRVSTGSWSGAGKAAVDGAVDGFANGFMTGGIMAGGSQILSSGFKVAANAGVPTGRNGGLTIGNKVRVLSPNHPQAYEAGGTLLKIGSKYKNIRFDVGSNSLLHMNIQLAKTANYHIPIGIWGAGVWGGIAHD